jgi:hypothetical protein
VLPDIAQYITPAAPSNLETAWVGTSPHYYVHLTWTDNSRNEDGFVVERTPSGYPRDWQIIDLVGPDTTEYLDDRVQSLMTYYYRVQGYNELAGVSEFSNEACTGCSPLIRELLP